MSVGSSPGQAAYTADMQRSRPTREEHLEARRRIAGGDAVESLPSGLTSGSSIATNVK